MATDPHIRASDDDRDKAASLLREHHAAGRLDAEEFDERLDKALSAKTMGDLDALLADLPHIDLYRLPGHGLSRGGGPAGSSPLAAAMAGPPARSHGRLSAAWGAAWGSWLTVSAVLIAIWVLSGAGYPWFAWIVGPWGIVMAGRWLSGGHPGGGGPGSPGSPGGPGGGRPLGPGSGT